MGRNPLREDKIIILELQKELAELEKKEQVAILFARIRSLFSLINFNNFFCILAVVAILFARLKSLFFTAEEISEGVITKSSQSSSRG